MNSETVGVILFKKLVSVLLQLDFNKSLRNPSLFVNVIEAARIQKEVSKALDTTTFWGINTTHHRRSHYMTNLLRFDLANRLL